jgi:predicted DNA-binding transcriptional regulator AlpA
MIDHVTLQPLLLKLPQVAQQLGLSQARAYQLVALKGLPTIKIGRNTGVVYGSLVQWVKEGVEP